MPGLKIAGSGHFVPGRPYTNRDLARVLDTSDEWIYQRTGIRQRHYCPEGVGVSDLAVQAGMLALQAAGRQPGDVDYILFSTMTPDHLFPGPGSMLAAKLGCRDIPSPDIRAQCASMLHCFQLADCLIRCGSAECILIAAAEAHAGMMPWRDWDILEGVSSAKPSSEDWARALRHRDWAVIFGDGAGALLLEPDTRGDGGVLAVDLHSDGRQASRLCVPAGYRKRPYFSPGELEDDSFLMSMDGREVFKHALTKLPETVQTVCTRAGITLDEVDWFVAHQGNKRINEAVADRLRIPEAKLPSNIERFGNTSAATIPILLDEMRRDGRLEAGQLVCLLAFGAGFHWGSVLVRI